jgi:hypothetical protein
MRTAPQWLCTYHNANERVCGREHWDQRIEIAATAELVIAIACIGLVLPASIAVRGAGVANLSCYAMA